MGLSGKIAFVSARGGYSKIYVMNADGTHETSLTYGNYDSQPCFSPDGKQIVWVGQPFINHEMYLMNADGRQGNFLDIGAEEPCFSPDGKRIVYTSDANTNEEIYVCDVDGTHKTRLTKNGGHDDSEHFYPESHSPSFSPDGKQIVFVTDRDSIFGRPRDYFGEAKVADEIYLMNSDGSDPVRLTHDDFADGGPCFSPDGQHIAYTSTRKGVSQIYLMNADGTNPVYLTPGDQNAAMGCFSPDGKQIAYSVERNSRTGIFLMNVDGTNSVRLTNGEYDFTSSWVPGYVPAPPVSKATPPSKKKPQRKARPTHKSGARK